MMKQEVLPGLKTEFINNNKDPHLNYMSCYCNKNSFIHKRKSNDFLHFVTLFLLIISVTQTGCSASQSRRRPSASWGIDNNRESDSRLNEYNDHAGKCVEKGDYLNGYSLSGGTKAGRYTNLGTVYSIGQCSKLCCEIDDCELAIMLLYPKSGTRSCFSVECYGEYYSGDCVPVLSAESKYLPYIFKKVTRIEENKIKKKTKGGLVDELYRNSRSKKEKGKGYCGLYYGTVCGDNMDKTKYYYYTTHNASTLDRRLHKPIKQLRSRLTGKCRILALQAICYRFYPQCLDLENPEPINICNDECNKLIYGDCVEDFRSANMLSYLKRVIPGCNSQDSGIITPQSEQCIKLETIQKLGESDKELSSIGGYTSTYQTKRLEESVDSSGDDDMEPSRSNSSSSNTVKPSAANSSTTISPTATVFYNIVSTTAPPSNFVPTNIATTTKITTKRTVTTIAATAKPTMPTVTTVNSTVYMKAVPPTPVIVEVKKSDDKEIDLEELDLATVTTPASHTPPPDAVVEEIRVSAGDNTVITLPVNHVNLFASTWPKEKTDGDYIYEWSLISSPSKSHGYIEGKASKNVKLTKLNVPGTYTLKLAVSWKDKNRHGIGKVNITVKARSRVNHPPRAEITPKDHVIQLPTNTVILDASKSTDDDIIVSYKWEELKGPIKEKTVFGSSTDTKILELKNLVTGEYEFRVTVTDSDGETDHTEATVTVKKEVDYPPKANAGSDVIIHLPNNSIILNGNKSTDDKGTANLKYQWSKTSESPTCDMQGTDKPQLILTHLQKGTYVFMLKVIDFGGQSSETQVKVVVLPEKNTVPVAVAGDDKELIYPDDSTTLDGSKSNDNSKIVSYLWEQVSGPTTAKLTGANNKKVSLTDLVAGIYIMKLTVTDDKGTVGTDTVRVHVKKDHNEPPVAVAGKSLEIFLPTRSVVLNGMKSHDDEMIENYLWTRAGLSPAAGVVINGSDHHPILRLTNLVKGRYIFDLTVTDNKGLTGVASVTVLVKESPHRMGLVELLLEIDIDNFSEESKTQLIRKISVVLEVGKEYVVVEEITGSTYGKGVVILFYVKDPNIERIFDGKYVADLIKQKIGFGGKLFEYTMQRVEPHICRNNCSDHGFCDTSTKQCVCDSFWTANFLKSKFGEKESNCDWSILYLSVAVFGIFLVFIGIAWAVCFCFARKKRGKRRQRYRALRTTDPDSKEEILLVPKLMKEKFSANSLTYTESDEDSELETTVFDKKKLVNGHVRMNGTANGKPKFNKDHL